MIMRAISALAILALPSMASAQALMQRTAVGSCQAVDGGDEFEYSGSSYLVPSNSDGVLFECPIDAALAAPGSITRAIVWLGDPSVVENATAQLCFTNLNATPSETCGPIVSSVGAGYSVQALTPPPPAAGPLTRTHVAFLKVYIPSPEPDGYGFFRGFRIE
jgi:hypothetical protein